MLPSDVKQYFYPYIYWLNVLKRCDIIGHIVGCMVHDISACPLGYADDMAAACLSKRKLEDTLNIAHQYSAQWEYNYNAKKSAVMVYGESRNDYKKGKRIFHVREG